MILVFVRIWVCCCCFLFILVRFFLLSKMMLSFWFSFERTFLLCFSTKCVSSAALYPYPFSHLNWQTEKLTASHLHSGNVTGARKALDFARICSNVYCWQLL